VLCCLLGSLLTILYRWWINSLFAHHAGIIGKESLDGGTTFDDHGAYAVVIKEENEVDTRPDGSLRYLTSMNDRGKVESLSECSGPVTTTAYGVRELAYDSMGL
jgi:hypothetical protein